MNQIDKGKKRKKILFRGSIITIAAIIVIPILYNILISLGRLWAPLILWLPGGNILLVPLSLLFTAATAVLIGYSLSSERVQKLINNLLAKIPFVNLFIIKKWANNIRSLPGALVELSPGGPYFIAAIIGRQRMKLIKNGKEVEEIWYKLYSPSAPIPMGGLPIIFSHPNKVIPLKISFGMVMTITTTFGKESPDILEQLVLSQAS